MFFFLLFIFFLLGLFFGSFLSVVIYRLKHQKSGIITGRSHCPICQHSLNILDLIPLISYLKNHARCRYCQQKISLFYPLIELSTAFSFTLIIYKLTIVSGVINYSTIILFLLYTSVLIIIFFYDYLYLEIPDQILIPAIIIAFTASFFSNKYLPNPKNALLGAAIPLSFFLAQIFISKGKWLGSGDLRIGTFMGLILGWKLVIVALLLSYFIGSIISLSLVIKGKLTLKHQVPFGPFLSLGTFITMLWGEEIINWYFNSLL